MEKKSNQVILKPRVTEKAVIGQEKRGVYAFNVSEDATKRSIALEIKAKYKVTPLSVRIARVPAKRKFFRGKAGMRSGGKKAYVYLKKGDKIDVA